MSKFYEFSSKGYLTTFAAWAEAFTKATENGYHGFHSGREIHTQLSYSEEYPKYIEFPVVFQHINGKRMRDILDMRGIGAQILISDRLRLLLEDNLISGWRSYQILLKDKKGGVIPGYSGFTVTGKGGELLLPGNKGWTSRYYEWYYWDCDNWDGSDFFELGGKVFVTERVRNLLKRNKIDAVEFVPIEESTIHLYDGTMNSDLTFVVFPQPPEHPVIFTSKDDGRRLGSDTTLSIIVDGLDNNGLLSIENCLERIRLFGSKRFGQISWFLGKCPFILQTNIRVERVIAIDRMFLYLYKALALLDNASLLLFGSLDPDSFRPCDFGGNMESVSDIEEWDGFIIRVIMILKRSLIDVYNALSVKTKCYAGIQGKVRDVYNYLEESLKCLSEAIHVLTLVSK